VLAALLTAAAVPALAQDEPEIGVWTRDFDLGINMLQSAYSNNWNGGDKGSINWAGYFNGKMEKQFSPTANWRNGLKLAYGQTHSQERNESGELYWKRPDKTDDIIDFESMFRWTLPSRWDPYVAFTFTSMFEDLSDVHGRSNTFNPLTFKESLGISRKLVNTEKRKLLSRLGVAFIQNSRKFFIDEPPTDTTQREATYELAAEWVTEYKVGALNERVDWESKLTLTLPFLYSGKEVFENDLNPEDWGLPTDVADYSTTLDVDFENTFTANITSLLSVKLFLRWVYDKYDNSVKPVVGSDGELLNVTDVHQAIRKAGQFKQTLALGLSYKFQ